MASGVDGLVLGSSLLAGGSHLIADSVPRTVDNAMNNGRHLLKNGSHFSKVNKPKTKSSSFLVLLGKLIGCGL